MNPVPMILGLLILWGLALVMLIQPSVFRLPRGITRAIGAVLLLLGGVYLAGALG